MELPPGVLMITMGVDVQKDRLEAMIVGWGANSESWFCHIGRFTVAHKAKKLGTSWIA